jgi:hypothetical protein
LGAIPLAELLRQVRTAGRPAWLVEELWPADAYGVLAAEEKAGKTWAGLDLAVSVAAGVPWLGRFACQTPGPVLLLLGEGGGRAMARRLEAIAAAKAVELESLAIRVCLRVPKLTSGSELLTVERELTTHPARLVYLDPLYLAATGARGSDLYEMGGVLAGIQGICQRAGAALMVVTHWNKTGEGRGAKRITGAGPAAWGRVLCSAAVEHRTTDADGTSNVLLAVEVTGSEVADQTFRVRRRIRATDPVDLGSPLVYGVQVTDSQPEALGDGLSPAQRRVVAALDKGGQLQNVRQLGDLVADDGQGPPLKKRTIQAALDELEARGLAEGTEGTPGLARYWTSVRP